MRRDIVVLPFDGIAAFHLNSGRRILHIPYQHLHNDRLVALRGADFGRWSIRKIRIGWNGLQIRLSPGIAAAREFLAQGCDSFLRDG